MLCLPSSYSCNLTSIFSSKPHLLSSFYSHNKIKTVLLRRFYINNHPNSEHDVLEEGTILIWTYGQTVILGSGGTSIPVVEVLHMRQIFFGRNGGVASRNRDDDGIGRLKITIPTFNGRTNPEM